jgi:thiamine kinase-like enzyme
MKIKERHVDLIILEEAAKVLEKRFRTQVTIGSAVYLSAPDRHNVLVRITLNHHSKDLPASIILKQSLPEKSDTGDRQAFGRFARDWAGLEFLSNLHTQNSLSPLFYSGSKKYRFVLMEDLGSRHSNLIDSLMSNDKKGAEVSLKRYMKVIGKFHSAASSNTREYLSILRRINPDALIWQDDFDDMLSKICGQLAKFGLPLDPQLKNEIDHVFRLAKDPGPFTTLMHGDICPDNFFDNLKTNELKLIDFEWSFVGNALLDAVVLRMCMPTSWSMKTFCPAVIESFELAYRNELIKTNPAARNNALYYESYVAAAAYWMLWRIVSLEDILEGEITSADPKNLNLHHHWQADDNLRKPRNIYRLETFIEISKKHALLPHLRSMAEYILKELKLRWPDVRPLEVYPAFR